MIHLRKTMTVSVLCHLALFGMFSLSFGPKAPLLKHSSVAFLGQVISSADLLRTSHSFEISASGLAFKKVDNVIALKGLDKAEYAAIKDFSKPQVGSAYFNEKESFFLKISDDIALPKKNKPVIMFYPQLPYHFMLYFKDRQMAHIELMFNIMQGEKRNSIMLKRRVSSGNLEVDLLCSRYISRYLSIQQMGFPWNSWQSVKIDLSPKNDQH